MESVKKFIKACVLHIIHFLSYKKTILFESFPDCADNTKAVFDEMVRRGLNRKYELVWVLHSRSAPKRKIPNVTMLPRKNSSLKSRLTRFIFFARAKCMISCNIFLLPVLKAQKAFFLTHGTPIKRVRHYYNVPSKIHYCLAASEAVVKFSAYEANYPEERMFALGFPRNDVFCAPAKDVKSILQTTCKKVVVWYPTFRQRKNGRTTGAKNALPIISDLDAAKQLNDCAREAEVLIVLKPHFAQDLSRIKELGLSNIRFITDRFFVNNRITSYEFVAGCDALITDYSSIYYDYTLADKPIAAIWEDVEEYRQEPGFAVDIDYYMKGAEKIYNLEHFKTFIENVASGKDVLCQERREIRDLTNYATDGKNTQRVVDFIVEKAKL